MRIKTSYGFGENVPFNITQQETREAILNKLHYNGPMTVNQLSQSIGIAQPVIHGHVKTLEEHDIIKEVEARERRKSRVERYYDLNIPIFSTKDQKRFQELANAFAEKASQVVETYFSEVKNEEDEFSFQEKGWSVNDPEIRRYLFVEMSHAVDSVLTRKGILADSPPGPDRKGRWRGYIWGIEYQEAEATNEVESDSGSS